MEAGIVPEIDEAGPGCEKFGQVGGESATLRRFLVGRDQRPVTMDAAEIERELNDQFALVLLRNGVFPTTPEDVFGQFDQRIAESHPLASGTERSFTVAEGSQIAKDPARRFDRRLRFLVTRGQGPGGPDLMISTFDPQGGDIEVMAWDDTSGGFNYYRTISGADGSWVWAGNSRHAWEQGTRASGPFESHPTGNLLFKELKLPWTHWHSGRATMDRLDLATGDQRGDHQWFANSDAYVLETLAKTSITRWNRTRIAQIAASGTIDDPKQLMERIVGSPEPRRSP